MSSKKLTLSEMAERLSITTKTLNKYIDLYQIPYIGLGRNKRFDADKVERLLETVKPQQSLLNLKPSKQKIEINNKSEWDFFSRELGLM
jgi:excisionase family DNA binding protein